MPHMSLKEMSMDIECLFTALDVKMTSGISWLAVEGDDKITISSVGH